MSGKQIKKSYVDCSAGQIHYAWRNGTGTPLVCFHQTASASTSYYRLMAEDRISNPIYALDTPGFGGSFDPEGMPIFEQYAAWLFEALAVLGIDKFYCLGHHTGAGICVALSSFHPDVVKGMVLIGPYPLMAEEREEFRQHFSKPIAPTEDGGYLDVTWRYLADLGAVGDLDLHHRELLNHLRAHQGRYQAYSAVWDYDFATPYQNAVCPILLMAAEDDVLYPYLSRARKMQPAARVASVAGANFEPDRDPVAIANAVANFIAEN